MRKLGHLLNYNTKIDDITVNKVAIYNTIVIPSMHNYV